MKNIQTQKKKSQKGYTEPDQLNPQTGGDNRHRLLDARCVGVKYLLGSKREDYQSRVYNLLLKKQTRRPFWALRDISIQGYAGDIVGVIGLNGAGKTTLCRVLAGLLRPDNGAIRVNGTVSALLSIGTGFNSQLSGRDNIYLNGMMLGFSKKYLDHIISEIITFSELDYFIEQPLKNYSSGMKARLGFSIAAMFQPDILILDEALSAGDYHFSAKAGEKLQDIIRQSKMVVIVSHRLDFIKQYCNRAIWLDKGEMRASGAPERVVDAYSDSSERTPVKKPGLINIQKKEWELGQRDVIIAEQLSIKFALSNKRKPMPAAERSNRTPFRKKPFFWALKDVDFRLREGEILGIVGSNAAGKSTLCRVISGILKPDEGRVQVNGQVTALLTIGTGFDLQLSGVDNVLLNGTMLGFSRKEIEALFQEIHAFSEIGDFIYQPVKSYSSGMRARLGFSIIAMLRPDIFIIDEALNAGDITFYEKSSAKIQDLMNYAKASIVVTHSLEFIENICTQALWLDQGQVVYQGRPETVTEKYRQGTK